MPLTNQYINEGGGIYPTNRPLNAYAIIPAGATDQSAFTLFCCPSDKGEYIIDNGTYEYTSPPGKTIFDTDGSSYREVWGETAWCVSMVTAWRTSQSDPTLPPRGLAADQGIARGAGRGQKAHHWRCQLEWQR